MECSDRADGMVLDPWDDLVAVRREAEGLGREGA
jgi:hypothetical protein